MKSITAVYQLNADVVDFEIESKDMETIANLKGYCGELVDPDAAFY